MKQIALKNKTEPFHLFKVSTHFQDSKISLPVYYPLNMKSRKMLRFTENSVHFIKTECKET